MKEGQHRPKEKLDQIPSNRHKSENSWIVGILIFLTGSILLIQNLIGWRIEKWWSIFLIVPALASIATAWQRYQEEGHLQRREILRPLVLGLLLVVIIPVLLFNLNWQTFLAILLVLAGCVLFIGKQIKSGDIGSRNAP